MHESHELPPRRRTRHGATAGLSFLGFGNRTEPDNKRAIAFFDGQNLFHAARKAFGYTYPNYDPGKLALAVCTRRGWRLQQSRFYTGVPSVTHLPKWYRFWRRKLRATARTGVYVYSRPLRYRTEVAVNGMVVRLAEEKGIDVRIAIDILSCAIRGQCDVALVFSQDQDFSEVADEIRLVARERGCWLKIASAFPVSEASPNRRGIDKTDWIAIERATYDACVDPRDYRFRAR